MPGEEIPDVGFEFSDKLVHFLEYLVLGVLLILVFRNRKVLLWGALFAVIDELHQFFIPGRECGPADLAMNLIGLVVSHIIVTLILCLKKKKNP